MADCPFSTVTMFRKTSHDATDRVQHPTGHPKIWSGKPRPVTQTYAKLCHTQDILDMDAFSCLQFCENNGNLFNGPDDIPTILLTQGCVHDWLGAPIPPIPNTFHNLSPAWGNYDDDTQFMTAHETGRDEFQTLLPTNVCKKGQYPLNPPNGTVITTSLAATGSATHGTKPMMMLLESTLLGPAAGTNTTGRRLVAYQIQMPTKRNETDNSKITELSETLEIVYEGTYELLGLQEGPTPIDITITMTWVINKRSSGVYQRYKNHPYL